MNEPQDNQALDGGGGEPHQLRVVARRNEYVLRRFQRHELTLMAVDSLHGLLRQLTEGTLRSFGLDAVALTVVDPGGEIADALERAGVPLAELPAVRLTPLPEWPGHEGTTPQLGPVHAAEHGGYFGERLGELQSAALLPLVRGGRNRGVLALGSRDPLRYQPHLGTDFLDHLAMVATVCLENALNQERLRHYGRTDPLTGLYNRRYLEARLAEEVSRARRHGMPLSCMFLDVDHFKRINDRHGHAAGDAVLRHLAERITELLRASDVAVRYGGEEFALLLPQTAAAEAAVLAERLRAHLAAQPIEVAGVDSPMEVTVSIGVAELAADEDGAGLLDGADRALYRAKAGGRNRVERRVLGDTD
ncbi:MAG: DUF484 family protein [Gammaproteobacteria bacterium]|nr:DUF484 family protein [Gammaproteobacteria bacterium]